MKGCGGRRSVRRRVQARGPAPPPPGERPTPTHHLVCQNAVEPVAPQADQPLDALELVVAQRALKAGAHLLKDAEEARGLSRQVASRAQASTGSPSGARRTPQEPRTAMSDAYTSPTCVSASMSGLAFLLAPAAPPRPRFLPAFCSAAASAASWCFSSTVEICTQGGASSAERGRRQQRDASGAARRQEQQTPPPGTCSVGNWLYTCSAAAAAATGASPHLHGQELCVHLFSSSRRSSSTFPAPAPSATVCTLVQRQQQQRRPGIHLLGQELGVHLRAVEQRLQLAELGLVQGRLLGLHTRGGMQRSSSGQTQRGGGEPREHRRWSFCSTRRLQHERIAAREGCSTEVARTCNSWAAREGGGAAAAQGRQASQRTGAQRQRGTAVNSRWTPASYATRPQHSACTAAHARLRVDRRPPGAPPAPCAAAPPRPAPPAVHRQV